MVETAKTVERAATVGSVETVETVETVVLHYITRATSMLDTRSHC